jgi:hypothetical protein
MEGIGQARSRFWETRGLLRRKAKNEDERSRENNGKGHERKAFRADFVYVVLVRGVLPWRHPCYFYWLDVRKRVRGLKNRDTGKNQCQDWSQSQTPCFSIAFSWCQHPVNLV